MKRLGLVIAAAAALMLATTPITTAQTAQTGQPKKLWEGFFEDLAKLHADVAARWRARFEQRK